MSDIHRSSSIRIKECVNRQSVVDIRAKWLNVWKGQLLLQGLKSDLRVSETSSEVQQTL